MDVYVGNVNGNYIQQQAAQAPLTQGGLNDLQAAGRAAAEAQGQAMNALEEALSAAGLRANERTLELAKQAMQSGLPLDAETLKTLNQALRLTGDAARALFLAGSGLPVNAQSAAQLAAIADGAAGVAAQLRALAAAIAEMPEGALKQQLARLMTQGDAPAPPNTQAAVTAQGNTQGNAQGAVLPQGGDTAQAAPQTAQAAPPQTAQTAQAAAQPQSAAQAQPAADPGGQGRPPLQQTGAPEAPQAAPQAAQNAASPAQQTAAPQTAQSNTQAAQANAPAAPPPQAADTARAAVITQDAAQTADMAARIVGRYTLPAGAGAREVDGALTELANRAQTAARLIRGAQNPPEAERKAQEETAKAARPELTREEAAKPLDAADRLVKNITFQNELKNPIYVQIPVKTQTGEADAEVYVFKDKRKKASKTGGSALLALDTANMGRVEAYLQKDGQSVACQFRVDGETAARIKPYAHELAGLLREKGYSLAQLSFTAPDKRFTLTDKEPGREEARAVVYGVDEKA